MTYSLKSILNKYIPKNRNIVVGVSGGPDSVYLLLQCLGHTNNIIVAHVNHGTRNGGSDKDAIFTEKLAKKLSLPFELKKIAKKNGGNSEEFFRNRRYEFFEKIRKKYKAAWILTAHHQNDNIETVLFNLTKGSFLDGISGMEIADPKRHLLRPLLFTPKKEILDHLKKNRIPFMRDTTNKSTVYARNRIRHRVIPQLKTINDGLEQTMSNSIQNYRELRDYLNQTTNTWLEQNSRENTINLTDFLKLHPVIQKSVLFRLYENYYGEGKKLNQKHLEQIMGVLSGGATGRKKEFGKDLFICIEKRSKIALLVLNKRKCHKISK
ncbi:tRNA lysidine(34) synthetase TilS [Patescibacteria group bacterium]|nr:tRNA lysidine(34) synthetase TilS [Patescibacteria group bacterium]MBU1703028.1 tRNA lysidine(34) synthetase TilS [Patescibacteria group bacterium]MBU1953924.1 tRNA lysidine(34) synthetase TilS [Patescibacteria group bacterium]